MKANPSDIYPTQDFLKPGTVQYIFDRITEGRMGDLPPAPIVRRGSDGELLAIDGHNLIAVMLYLGKEIEVHIAESSEDGLDVRSEKDITRNQELADKYDTIPAMRNKTMQAGIATFQDLISKYQEMFDENS